MKTIVIRADGGGMTGTGHLMRMIALAQAIARRGGRAVIATVSCPAPIIDRITGEGLIHRSLAGHPPGSATDARSTLALASELEASWIVLDGYHFDLNYQNELAFSSFQILCLDDHGYSEEWNCDAILNQNLDAQERTSYRNLNPDSRFLLGSSFCLLREEFLRGKPKRKPWKGISRLVVTLGGSDPDNASLEVLKLLNQTDAAPLEIRLIVGPDNPNLAALRSLNSRHKVEFLTAVDDMPAQYLWAEGIISAGGSTCWEWLHTGLPGAIVTIADNQEPIVEAICTTHQAALSLGWFTELGARAEDLSAWLRNPNVIIIPEKARGLIDGRGADRVTALLLGDLKIHFLTQAGGWMSNLLGDLIEESSLGTHRPSIYYYQDDLPEGDLLFILSYWDLLDSPSLAKHHHNLVIHESELPKGKGWSPLTWQILEGKDEIPFTLFEAVEKVDAGDIYLRSKLQLKGHELVDDLRTLQARESIKLCEQFVERYPEVVTNKRQQTGEETFYDRRTPASTELDPKQSLVDQFNLLRTVDNEAYPAYFFHKGRKYFLKIHHADHDEAQ